MFFLFPIGHDQPVYTQPIVTISIIALCSVIYLWSYESDKRWERNTNQAAMEMGAYLEAYPESRFDLEQLDEASPAIRAALQTRLLRYSAGEDDEVDEELEALVYGVTDAFGEGPSAMRFGYTPGDASVLSALSSLFMHGGFFHLLGNMLFLFLAGSVIECFWGSARFLIFYLLAGFAATLAHHVSAPGSMIPLVGASGAISALLGAFLIGHHRARIRMLFLVVWIRPILKPFYLPALVALPGWAALQIFSMVSGAEDNVAYAAHVGGFFMGLAAAALARKFNWAALDGGSL